MQLRLRAELEACVEASETGLPTPDQPTSEKLSSAHTQYTAAAAAADDDDAVPQCIILHF